MLEVKNMEPAGTDIRLVTAHFSEMYLNMVNDFIMGPS